MFSKVFALVVGVMAVILDAGSCKSLGNWMDFFCLIIFCFLFFTKLL